MESVEEKNMVDFYAKLTEILEVQEVRPEDMLADFANWDSLSVLSVIALADAYYGVTLTADDLKQIPTAGELFEWLTGAKSD